MADEAPAPARGAPAQGGGGGGGRRGEAAQNDSKATLHESVQQMKNGTSKPTVTKSAFDVHISGIATPLSRPLSRQSIALNDYFVS